MMNLYEDSLFQPNYSQFNDSMAPDFSEYAQCEPAAMSRQYSYEILNQKNNQPFTMEHEQGLNTIEFEIQDIGQYISAQPVQVSQFWDDEREIQNSNLNYSDPQEQSHLEFNTQSEFIASHFSIGLQGSQSINTHREQLAQGYDMKEVKSFFSKLLILLNSYIVENHKSDSQKLRRMIGLDCSTNDYSKKLLMKALRRHEIKDWLSEILSSNLLMQHLNEKKKSKIWDNSKYILTKYYHFFQRFIALGLHEEKDFKWEFSRTSQL